MPFSENKIRQLYLLSGREASLAPRGLRINASGKSWTFVAKICTSPPGWKPRAWQACRRLRDKHTDGSAFPCCVQLDVRVPAATTYVEQFRSSRKIIYRIARCHIRRKLSASEQFSRGVRNNEPQNNARRQRYRRRAPTWSSDACDFRRMNKSSRINRTKYAFLITNAAKRNAEAK